MLTEFTAYITACFLKILPAIFLHLFSKYEPPDHATWSHVVFVKHVQIRAAGLGFFQVLVLGKV